MAFSGAGSYEILICFLILGWELSGDRICFCSHNKIITDTSDVNYLGQDNCPLGVR